jgi:hypothetical protein
MNRAIEDLERLKERFPGIMNIVKVINGFDADCSPEELVALNARISEDEEAMAVATRAITKLMADSKDGDPEVRQWLEDNHFVSQRAIDAQKEMDAIVEAIESGEYHSIAELEAMTNRLLDLQEEFIRTAQRHEHAMGKGLFGMGEPVSE